LGLWYRYIKPVPRALGVIFFSLCPGAATLHSLRENLLLKNKPWFLLVNISEVPNLLTPYAKSENNKYDGYCGYVMHIVV
jgi:hypothetical protein